MTFETVKVAAGAVLLLFAFAALVGFRPSRVWRKFRRQRNAPNCPPSEHAHGDGSSHGGEADGGGE